MKNKVIQFIKYFIIMAIVISIVEFIFYKLKIISSFDIVYIIGFMIGWSIIQIVKLSVESKKIKNNYKLQVFAMISGGEKMKISKATIILSCLATICFFVAYFIKKDNMMFILGCAWICITIEECLRIKSKNDKENKKTK